ncbi:hypothetical protein H0H81_005662 [Sphagnurus paluster]|uniref:Uncharacterized protein n=1 Tax=Sphagnurus paluster TaxID=117069 RepID=A0A9P7FS36_9AGAR|nr:hypothetical protein H0H81_005662 [Sphagnurus paluster]
MNPPSALNNDPPNATVRPAPVGTSIQVGTDMILNLIESDRAQTAKAFRDRYTHLEQCFTHYQNSARASFAAEQAKVHEAHQKLIATQALLTQYQQYVASGQGNVQPNPDPTVHVSQGQMTVYRITADEGDQVASLKRRFDDLQTALRDVGILFSAEDNSLRFEAGWGAVLAQLDTSDYGQVMKAGHLHQVLEQLEQRLQKDRETIAQLQERVVASEQEKKQMVENYLVEIDILKLENEMLREEISRSSQAQALPGAITAEHQHPGEPSNPRKQQGYSDLHSAIDKRLNTHIPQTALPTSIPYIDLRTFKKKKKKKKILKPD